MATVSGKSGLVARRYASALMDMAVSAKSLEAVEKDLLALQAMMAQSDDLRRVVLNPLIGRTAKQAAIVAIANAAKFQGLTVQFLGTLAQNGRLPGLDSVITAFMEAVAASRGETSAQVETAYALSPAQTTALQEQLSKAMGSHVTLNVSVNKDLLGGMIVTVGSTMIDDSVRRKLEKLRRAMNDKAA